MSTAAKLFVGQIPFVADEEQVKTVFETYGTVKEVYLMRDKGTGASKGSAFVTFNTKEEADVAIASLDNIYVMPPQTHALQVRYAESQTRAPASREASSQQQYLGGLQGMQAMSNMGGLGGMGGMGAMASMLGMHPAMLGLQSPMMQPPSMIGMPSMNGGLLPQPLPRSSPGSKAKGPPGGNLMVLHIPNTFGDDQLFQLFQSFGSLLSAHVFVDPHTNVSKDFGFVSFSDAGVAQQAIAAMNGWQIGQYRLKVELKAERYAPY